MRLLIAILLVGMVLIFSGCTVLADKGVAVKKLRCEYRFNPLGIDVVKPRLSWILESGQRGQKQNAYQLLVADSEEKLKQNKGNLLDSGKVESDQSIHIVYEGKPLKSRMQCCWKVRVWDKDGRVSAWSELAFWTMGLLNTEDWQAEWIGYDAEPPESYQKAKADEDALELQDCGWIWLPEDELQKNAPICTLYFRRSFSIAAGRKIKRARFRLAADNNCVLFINGKEAGKVSGWTSVSILDVTGMLTAGDNTLAVAVTNTGDAANPAGLIGRLFVEFEGAESQVVPIDRSWKAANLKMEQWQEPSFDDSDWPNVREIAKAGEQPWGKLPLNKLILPPPPYLRKDFSVESRIKRAVVYASALGLYELHINGQRVGADYFTPGWTDYPTRVYYQTYDVTELLVQGDNAIGAILADGWYAGYLGWKKIREHYGSEPRLFVQLEIEYAPTNGAGGTQTIVTDRSWKAAYGPHLEADFLMGEHYDARKEIPSWDSAGFDDSGWNTVASADSSATGGKVQSYPGVPVRARRGGQQIKPVRITEPEKGKFVFDMGQNFVGFVRLKVNGRAGDKVVMRFAEVLNPDGTIYTDNLRDARCTDTYILKGEGEEIWQPAFTFHGFRYVEVTGYPHRPALDALTGIVVHSDTPPAGSFECSNAMVNQLWRNIVWGQRSNFIEVPTDCPQRDERLGWTGDAQIFIRTATYNMDVAAFFTKWLIDLEDAQSAEGGFPDVAPRKVATGDGTAAWGDAGVICPWTIYEVYGDKRVIVRHYEAMKKWIDYLQKHSENLLRPAEGYGDWVSIEADTPKDVIATAYFAYSTRLLSKMAAAIGKSEDAKKYETLFEQIKNAFNQAYISEDAHIKGDTQTCYLLGLHFDLLAEEARKEAAGHLIEAIRRKNWHLSTGFVGLSYLLPTLTQTGHLETAYRLLNKDTFPSWGYSIKNGATTIWERWDGWTEEKGFQDPGMNSFNHYAFGSVGRWLFGTVAGIDTEESGYKQIIIRPRPGGGFSYAKASYKSIHGKIATHWRIDGDVFKLDVTIPANTTATVYVPAGDAESVTESSKAASKTESVRFLRMDDGKAVYEVGSGNYRFASRLP